MILHNMILHWLAFITPKVQLRILYLLSFAAIIAALLPFFGGLGFPDSTTFIHAAEVFSEGGNPYRLASHAGFVYPPIFLYFTSLFGTYLYAVMIGFYIACIVFFLRSPVTGFAISLFLLGGVTFLPQPVLVSITSPGNISTFGHMLILGFWFRRDPSWNYTGGYILNHTGSHTWGHTGNHIGGYIFSYGGFYLSAIIFSLIKPYFAAYFLLPMLTDRIDRRQIIIAATSILTVALIYYAQWIFDHHMFMDFLQSIYRHQFTGSPTVFHRDIGYGLFRYLERILYGQRALEEHNPLIPTIIHFTIIGLLMLAWKVRVQTILEKCNTDIARTVLLHIPIILCIILNPRLKVYDYFIVQTLLIHFFWHLGTLKISPLNNLPIHGVSVLTATILCFSAINYFLAPITRQYHWLYDSLYVVASLYVPLILYAVMVRYFVVRTHESHPMKTNT